ncbi:MAG: hypothetical protein HOQ24_04810 [Mycobacteriaceae bacterium]|nr:hypothetical protein [Mycobacteriaceae bacterium]
MTVIADLPELETGSLLAVNPLPREFWPEGAVQGYRIEYIAPNFSGGKRAVGGSVFVPAVDAQAPVLTWAHCTMGLNEHNAPSKVGLIPQERAHLAHWLRAGFVVAATDYEGLGTTEPHPYLDGEAIADDIIDIVRAVHSMDLKTDKRTVIAGFSQGGHGSLFAAALCTSYAPELELLGTVSLAPPVHILDFVREYTQDGAQKVHALIPTILSGLRTRRTEFTPETVLTPAGRALLDAAANASMQELDALCSATTNDKAGITGISSWGPLIEALESTSPPETRYDRPMWMCAGGADPVFTSAQGRKFSGGLADAGTQVTFRDFESLDHVALLEPAAREATRWAADLIGAAPAHATSGQRERSPDWDSRFGLLDVTGDGRIGLDDFRAHGLRLVQSFRRPLGDPVSTRVRRGYEQLARQLIQYCDTDGDGTVDPAEFRAAAAGTAQIAESAKDLVQAVIGLIDSDSDQVSRAQFRTVAAGLGIAADESDAIFARTDVDGSGQLSADEFAASVVDFLTGANPDSPGYWLFGRQG